jgi:hypothetical protein
VITHIALQAVLRTSLAVPYADLVTRPTGRAVRASIEETLDADAAIALLDFTGFGLIDFSCADEIVAKLSRDRVLLVGGLTEGHREALEPVLEAAGLAVLCPRADGTLDALGRRSSAEPLLEELVSRRVATRTAGGAVALAPA